MKKQNVKKLELAKETLRSLDLRNVAGKGFDPEASMNAACTFTSIAYENETS